MKTYRTRFASAVVLLANAVLLTLTASAQMRPGGQPGMSPDLVKYFGENNSFTATAECNLKPANQKEPMTLVMKMVMLEGQVRTELDMAQMKGSPMPPEAMAQMKQMGMDKIVTIAQPDRKSTFIIYPSLQAYAQMALPASAQTDTNKMKLEKTVLGKETIDGHPCEKNKVTLTDDTGKQHEAIVWNASDLKNFPVQMEMTENNMPITMKFSDIKLEKPDAKLFEPPAGFTKYDSMQQLMQSEVMKRMGNGTPKQ